jgi:transposase
MTKNSLSPQIVPDAEVSPGPRRRSFTGEYKAAILAECDSVTEPGQIGAILRREGLYSSHLVDWRRRREAGGAQGLAPKKTGRPPRSAEERATTQELERLRRENAALQEKLRKSQLIVEAQKKLAEVLDSLRESASGSTG